MLWEADRHEPVCDSAWDAALARRAVRQIAAEAERAVGGDHLWPEHPLDGAETGPRTGVYFGAAGVGWALDQLRRRGAIETPRDWIAESQGLVDICVRTPEAEDPEPSWFLGEVGVRVVADADRDRIYELIESNIEHKSLETLWGAPGTMLPALFLFERTGDDRWRDLYLRNAEFLIDTLHYHDDFDVWMWTQDLYGEIVRLLGSGHGFAGNAFSLLRGLELLSPERRDLVCQRVAHTLKVTARADGDLVNWAPHVGQGRRGRDAMLMQWCHGAPGMITGLARLPADPQVDDLFARGAESTWRAGPLAKGPGLCHGTAGNGYAFLAMHARTGQQLWLDRARRFATHALAQVQAAREQYACGRYSLWTGDVGVAMYAQDCIDGAGELPALAYV